MKKSELLAITFTSLIPLLQAIPLLSSINLSPKLPTFRLHPDLNLTETRTHFHATITHPLLENATARITLSERPLTIHIHTSTGRYLIRRIYLKSRYEDVAIETGDGVVILHFRKRVPDIGKAIAFCERHGKGDCLKQLVRRVCLSSRRDEALRKLARDDGSVEKVLEVCQREDILAVGSRIVMRLVFGAIVNTIILFYGWGFLLAIASIPKEVVRMVSWTSKVLRQIHKEGVKKRLLKEVMRII